MWSSFFNFSITISPTTGLGISDLPIRISSASISSTIFSILPVGRGRFSQALRIPVISFSRLKSSRRLSFLIMTILLVCTLSYVVNLKPQPRHSRRRRTSSFTSRESVTLVSLKLHWGHFMEKPQPLYILWGLNNIAQHIGIVNGFRGYFLGVGL